MLSCFIHEHMQEILADWETFASSLTPAADTMSLVQLRDHAETMLRDIAKDIETAQTPQQQEDKSKDMKSPAQATDSAASQHGAGRQASNFTLLQLTAEYRALRASVLRLWLPNVGQMDESTVNQLMRFNEAVDQALAESVVAFSDRSEYMRDLFLAILGHDLRTPLSTVAMAGELFTHPNVESRQVLQVGANVKRSAAFMSAMVDDLLGYAHKHLGSGLPIQREDLDLRDVCEAAINGAGTLYPHHTFKLDVEGELVGAFDRVEVQQLLNNLLANAGQYGSKDAPVTLAGRAEADDVVLSATTTADRPFQPHPLPLSFHR